MGGTAFSPEEFVEATKDFIGVIVDADYGMEPLGMVGAPGIERRPQLCIKIETDAYEKPQFEWYAPSRVVKTKWHYFIQALAKLGALKDTDSSGRTVEERLKNFARSLIGMKFRWLEVMDLEGVARPISRVLLPEEYLGRVEVKPSEVKMEKVSLE